MWSRLLFEKFVTYFVPNYDNLCTILSCLFPCYSEQSLPLWKTSGWPVVMSSHGFDPTQYVTVFGKGSIKPAYGIALLMGSVLLTSCGGYPRYLDFPFDAGGRGLNSPAEELTPQIASPYVVFISDRYSSQAVYLFDTQRRRLVDLPGLNSLDEIASHPAITEDGRYIVFCASRQGKSDIYLYDRETQQKRNLTASLNFETRNPTISADGDRIAFEIAQNGQWDIMVMDGSGTVLNN